MLAKKFLKRKKQRKRLSLAANMDIPQYARSRLCEG